MTTNKKWEDKKAEFYKRWVHAITFEDNQAIVEISQLNADHLWNWIESALQDERRRTVEARKDGFTKGYIKGVYDREWGQITADELSDRLQERVK